MFADLLEKLRRHRDLSTDEAARAMGRIMDGEAQPAHIAGLLMALALGLVTYVPKLVVVPQTNGPQVPAATAPATP